MKLMTKISFVFGISAILLLGQVFIAANQRFSTKLMAEEVARKTLPSIVRIGIAHSGNSTITTVGTGVVVRSDGYILTAKHNISISAHVFIKASNGEQYVVGYMISDAQRDLALLKVDTNEHGLPAIKLGGSDIQVGEEVLALGFPATDMVGGLPASVSHGIISGVQRTVEEPLDGASEKVVPPTKTHEELWQSKFSNNELELLFGSPKAYSPYMLQMDTPVNPGSSGGAVVNMQGQLIGIVHSMITKSGGSNGINFAIPIDEAITILGTMIPRKGD